MSDTRDALSDLVKHPGWALFTQHCLEEWGLQGARYHQEMEKALNEEDSKIAHLKALQVAAAKKIVESMLGWPGQEVSRLSRLEEPVGASLGRGGYNR